MSLKYFSYMAWEYLLGSFAEVKDCTALRLGFLKGLIPFLVCEKQSWRQLSQVDGPFFTPVYFSCALQVSEGMPTPIAWDTARAEGMQGTSTRKLPSPETNATARRGPPPPTSRIHPNLPGEPRPYAEVSAEIQRRWGTWSRRSEVSFPSGHLASSKEVGCHVLVRLWRYRQTGKPALERLELAVHDTVLCSDMGLSLSPCGKMLALCAAPEVGAVAIESKRHEFHFALLGVPRMTTELSASCAIAGTKTISLLFKDILPSTKKLRSSTSQSTDMVSKPTHSLSWLAN